MNVFRPDNYKDRFLVLSLLLLSLVLPVISKFHRSRPPKKPTTKKAKNLNYEEYSDNTSSMSRAETYEIPEDYEERKETFEAVRRDLLRSTGEGREPDPLPPPTSYKRLLADMKRDLVDDLMTKLVILMGDKDMDKIRYLIFDDYHVKTVNTVCYKHATAAFSKICINITLNPYLNRYMNVFANACDAEWLPGSVMNACMKQVCEGINKMIDNTI